MNNVELTERFFSYPKGREFYEKFDPAVYEFFKCYKQKEALCEEGLLSYDDVLFNWSEQDLSKIYKIYCIALEYKALFGDERIISRNTEITYSNFVANLTKYSKRTEFYAELIASVFNYYDLIIMENELRRSNGQLSKEHNQEFMINKISNLMEIYSVCINNIGLLDV